MEQIGKYAVVRQIGMGGFGVVYEGRDPFLKRRVAIKTCSSEEPDIRDRFFREAEIAGNLHDSNIVTVHDFGVQDGVPYLVQEYLTGEDLDRVVARREPLPPARRVDILVQAARGLAYAHAHGVIHRDVKPANIRLTAEGVVKIMDFGIAKLSNVASHLTRTGMTLGTAAYLPPEQIRGTTVDHRADIFSFGITAYELLTYRRPFSGKTISALFWELLQREPEPLTMHWVSCPHFLEAVVMRCLAKDPARRYGSFGELIPELEAALADLLRPGRGEETTALHGQVVPRAPAPAPPPAPPTTAPPAPRRPAANERFEAAVTAVRKLRPPETGGLLSDVQEALAGAGAAAIVRRGRELLASGDLEGAERELASVPARAGGDVTALRRDIARARTDRLLAQAAAQWQQGEPQPALALLDQLLALAPDHQDALRLRQAWRDELAERERLRAEAAAEAGSRRQAIAQAVAEAETLLARGDLDGAESVLAAAQAGLGSHQPLRDLRRRVALTRAAAGGGAAEVGDGARGGEGGAGGGSLRPSLLEASTVGVAAGAVAAARQRVDAAASAGSVLGSMPATAASSPSLAWRPPGLAGPPAGGRVPPTPAGPYGWQAEPGAPGRIAWLQHYRWLLLIASLAVLLVALVLLGRFLLARRSGPPVVSPAPTLAAAPSPAASPAAGIGGQATRPVASPDRPATVLQHPPAAFPSGVPARQVEVALDVVVDAAGRPRQARLHPGVTVDPRLVAEAQRVAMRSTYLPAVRNGVPVEQQITIRVSFQPPSG